MRASNENKGVKNWFWIFSVANVNIALIEGGCKQKPSNKSHSGCLWHEIVGSE